MTRQYHIRGSTAKEIAESIELAIDAGRFGVDQQLPTIRSLAESLAVSPTTVNAAFARLRAHGRISGRRRGGSVVLGRPSLQSARNFDAPPWAGRDLSVANPDPALLPPLRAPLDETAGRRRLYGDAREDPHLLVEARRRLERDGVATAHVAVTGGAVDGIERVLMAHLRPGDAIAVEDPSYPVYRELARVLGLRVVPVALDAEGIRPDSLESAIGGRVRAVITIPRAQNPTGISLAPSRAKELRKVLARAPELLLIEDDYLADVSLEPLVSLAAGRSSWAYVRSVAKTLGPDLRLAILAGDALTIGRVTDRQRICGWISHLVQGTVAALWREPATSRLLRTAAKTYASRRTRFIADLRANGLTGLGDHGFNVWVPLDDEAAAIRAAAAGGWAVDAGARYRIASAPGVRVTITTLTADESARLAATLAGAGRPRDLRSP